MTEHWKEVSLGDVLFPVAGKRKTQRGWSPQCEASPASNDQWGVLRTTAVQMGWFEPGENKALPPDLVPRPEIEVAEGDLLLLTTGPRNRCGIPTLVDQTPGKLMMSGKMIRLRPNPEQAIGSWLLYFLLSAKGQSELERLKVGSSDSSVSIGADALTRIAIPLPPLDEQRRIVAELEEQLGRLNATRTQLTQAETQLEQLRASTLNNYFGSGTQRVSWDMIPLGSLVLEQRKLVTPKPEVEYEVWAVTAYANGSPDVSYGREIKSSKQIVEPGDVLISKINPRINRVWQVTESHLPQIASTEWLSCRVRDATQVDSEYLVRFLQSPVFRNWIAASSSSVTGSHSRAKSREILKQMVPVPPLDEQRRIVAELEDQLGRLNATSTQLAQIENQFEQLRASVLHRAFSGGRDD